MKQKEFIQKLTIETGYTSRICTQLLHQMIDFCYLSLRKGGEARIDSLGTFYVGKREAHNGYDINLMTVVAKRAQNFVGFRKHGGVFKYNNPTYQPTQPLKLVKLLKAAPMPVFINKLRYKDEMLIRRFIPKFIKVIADAMNNNQRVIISRLGAFQPVNAPAYNGRNPKTGASIIVPARLRVKFKPSQVLNDSVN